MRKRADTMTGEVWRLAHHWVKRELAVLLALLVIVGGVWVFIELADEIDEGERQRVDEAVVMMMREADRPDDPIGPAVVEQAMMDLTALGGHTLIMLITLAVLGFLLLRRYYGQAALLAVAVVGGGVLSQGFKMVFDRPRPDLVPHLTHAISPSFPSGHATLAAVVYLTLGALLAELFVQRRLKLYFLSLALALAVLVGVTRVYLGVHWPSDVLAGWALGLAWAALVWIAARLLTRYRRWRRARVQSTPAGHPERADGA